MFRFFLRIEYMVLEFKILLSFVLLEKLDIMMEELKKELFEVFFFVNNVKKIIFCEVNRINGDLENVYIVEVVMLEEDDIKRWVFVNYIKEIGRLLKERRDVFLIDI